MFPRSAIISSFLAKEYEQILRGSLLVKSEYHRRNKDFRFLFRGRDQHHICYSFAPPKFVLLSGWPEKITPPTDSIAIWLEANDHSVVAVSGPKNDRIIEIQLERADDRGALETKRIVFELLGAQSTALLVDENGLILQATRVTSDERSLRPKRFYVAPTPIPSVLEAGMVTIGSDSNVTYSLDYNERGFRVLPSPAAEALDLSFPLTSLHAYLQRHSEETAGFAQHKARVIGVLNREIKKNQKTIEKTLAKLQAAEDAERLKRWGDILMAAPDAKATAGVVTLHDFYSDEEIEIPLQPGKGVIETASHFYRKAKKLQRSKGPLEKTLAELRSATAELERQRSAVADAPDTGALQTVVAEFQIDLSGSGGSSAGQREATSPYYREFIASTGDRILVGKSAEGNAHLTFKVARGFDLWFHAQQSPGSHVILVRQDKNRDPLPKAIHEAAQLAAAYSTQKKSQAVSVIYTERRYVRKVRKGAPGQVIPQNVKSLLVEPGIPPGVSEAS